MPIFLFWMEHCGIGNISILRFVKLAYWHNFQTWYNPITIWWQEPTKLENTKGVTKLGKLLRRQVWIIKDYKIWLVVLGNCVHISWDIHCIIYIYIYRYFISQSFHNYMVITTATESTYIFIHIKIGYVTWYIVYSFLFGYLWGPSNFTQIVDTGKMTKHFSMSL